MFKIINIIGIKEVRSKILILLETTGGISFSQVGSLKRQFFQFETLRMMI